MPRSGLFSIVATALITSLCWPTAAEAITTDKSEVRLGWAPAPGPVAGYFVYVARDGAPFGERPDAATPAEATTLRIAGKPGETLRVRVTAHDASLHEGPPSRQSEEIRFVAPRTTPSDFDGNGTSDLLWRHAETGELLAWLMLAGAPSASAPVAAPTPTRLPLFTSGDLDADGRSDVLWEHHRGDPHVLLFTARLDGRPLGLLRAPPGPGAQIVAHADFDGDGLPDLLWQDAELRRGSLWLLDGTHVTRIEEMEFLPGPAWRAAAVTDLEGDGRAEVVWQEREGSGLRVLRPGAGSGTTALTLASPELASWRLEGAGDFDGDGRGDLVWTQARGGPAVVTLMESAGVRAYAAFPSPGPAFGLAGTGDYDGDGLCDVLWRDAASGHVAAGRGGARAPVQLAPPGPGWELVPPR